MSELEKSLLAKHGLNLLPGTLKRAIFENDDFLSEFGLSVDASISFDGGVADFRTSKLFAAIRGAAQSGGKATLQDTAGNQWILELPDLPTSGTAVLSRQGLQLTYADAAYLLPDPGIRMATLAEAKKELALPASIFGRWESILKDRPLLDSEAAKLHDGLASGPVLFAQTLRRAIELGESRLDQLVPSNPTYYDQLIGELSGSSNVQEHAVHGLSHRVRELIEWDERRGFLNCFLLASHSAFTATVPIEDINPKILLESLRSLQGSNERLSQLGAIEIGLRALPIHPELEDDLIKLIEEIRDDDPTSEHSGFRIMSDLFILVDAHIGKRRVLGSAPPFYRRLASFAHAALIFRIIRTGGADPSELCDWSRKNCTGQFYLQSLVDMRLEPRWYPDLLQPVQLKAEFFGRLIIAGHDAEEYLPPRLADLLLLTSEHPASLGAAIEMPWPFFPGPLDGAMDYQRELPVELRAAIDKQIGTSVLSAASFIALVNSVSMFSISSDVAERAGDLLRQGRYHLYHLENHEQLMIILHGLARVAAVSRSTSLAQELRVLVRRYRHDAQFTLAVDDAFRVMLFAAGAFSDAIEWANFVGDNLRELAFGELSETDAATLHSQMRVLCEAVPELWVAVGRADAALASINS